MALTSTADITPETYSYCWCNEEQTHLKRTDAEGNVVFVPADPLNYGYKAFLSSGATAEAYVAPPEPEPLTTEEKVTRLLSDYGLSREELQAILLAD
jgi:hypothetical protein